MTLADVPDTLVSALLGGALASLVSALAIVYSQWRQQKVDRAKARLEMALGIAREEYVAARWFAERELAAGKRIAAYPFEHFVLKALKIAQIAEDGLSGPALERALRRASDDQQTAADHYQRESAQRT